MSATPIPTSDKDIVFEAQVPVNEKFRRKALTPPVSLKQFFHVEPKPMDTHPLKLDSSVADPNMQEGDCKRSDKSQKFPLESKECGKSKGVQMKLLDSFAARSTDVGSTQSSSDKGPSARKRRFQEETTAQGSLPKLFKQASNICQSICPVCGVLIKDVSNSGINLHIDKCLEKSSPSQL